MKTQKYSWFDINTIKLVIWDLDNTFWNGIISEHGYKIISDNITLIKNLTKKGIVNSICSKNDFENCKNALLNENIWDYFVFPSINWDSKGQRIKNIIEKMALRECNVLFIDDEPRNLDEAKFISKDLQIATPDILPVLIDSCALVKKDDSNLSRLNNYKILEKKQKAKEVAISTNDFLFECGINVEIKYDCISQIDRLYEMIIRTNQLNFTKKRLELKELKNILEDINFNSGYILCKDKFGDYGIVGFFAVKNNVLEHFLFSCRIMGMGVEQYVYNQLNYPQITIAGDVAVKLSPNGTAPWINNNVKVKNQEKAVLKSKILFKGPCDMAQLFAYINETDNIECEFTYPSVKNGTFIEQHNHTSVIVQSYSITNEQIEYISNELPFGDSNMFSGKIFDNSFKYVFFSMFTDGGLGVYKRKATGEFVAFSEYSYSLTDSANWKGYIDKTIACSKCSFTEEDLKNISEKYEYIGRLSIEQILENLTFIRRNMSPDSKLILLLGSEIPYLKDKRLNYLDRHIFHKELNFAIKEWINDKINVEIINFTDYINSQSDYFDNINHFMKPVYYRVAQDIIKYINLNSNISIKTGNKLKFYKDYIKQLIKKITK